MLSPTHPDFVAGMSNRRSAYGKTKAEALQKLRALETKAPTPKGSPTVANVIEQWRKVVLPNLERNTVVYYESNLRNHAGALNERPIAKITRAEIDALLAKVRTGATRRAAFESLKSVFSFAVEHGLLRASPLEGMAKPKRDRRERVRTWTAAETKRVLEASKAGPFHAVFALALGTGLRRGEIFGLRVRDVDLEAGRVTVSRSLEEISGILRIKEPKTASGARTIELPAFVVDAIRRMLADREDQLGRALHGDDDLFVAELGGKIRRTNFDRRWWYPTLAKAGVSKRTMHEARHTHASQLLAAGVPMNLVAKRLGHASVTTTILLYAHLTEGGDTKAADLINTLLA